MYWSFFSPAQTFHLAASEMIDCFIVVSTSWLGQRRGVYESMSTCTRLIPLLTNPLTSQSFLFVLSAWIRGLLQWFTDTLHDWKTCSVTQRKSFIYWFDVNREQQPHILKRCSWVLKLSLQVLVAARGHRSSKKKNKNLSKRDKMFSGPFCFCLFSIITYCLLVIYLSIHLFTRFFFIGLRVSNFLISYYCLVFLPLTKGGIMYTNIQILLLLVQWDAFKVTGEKKFQCNPPKRLQLILRKTKTYCICAVLWGVWVDKKWVVLLLSISVKVIYFSYFSPSSIIVRKRAHNGEYFAHSSCLGWFSWRLKPEVSSGF